MTSDGPIEWCGGHADCRSALQKGGGRGGYMNLAIGYKLTPRKSGEMNILT